jgi:hypothetical protein
MFLLRGHVTMSRKRCSDGLIFYCSAISTIFQTFLKGFLVDLGYENQLTSLEEILDSGIEFGYNEDANTFFSVPSDLRHKDVFERAEICSTNVVCLYRIRETGNFAKFAPKRVVQNYTNIINIINDHSTVCLLNDDDYEFIFLPTYMQKGNYFLESLNKYTTLSMNLE